MKFGTAKDHGHTFKSYLSHCCVWWSKCGDLAKFCDYIGTNAEPRSV